MATLQEILSQIGQEAKDTNKIVTRVLKIKGLKRLVVQLNAVPNGNSVRYSMTLHSANNYRKQIGITANDSEDLKLISEFLRKYADLLNEYVRFSPRNNANVREEELELNEEEESQKEEKKERRKERKSVEEEF